MTLPNEIDKVDAMLIYKLFEDLSKKLSSQVQSISESVTVIQRNSLKTNEAIDKLITSLAETRDQRYQLEIETLNGQLDIVKRQFKLMEEELNKKRVAKVDNLSTSKRMAAIASNQIVESEEDRVLKRNAFWREVVSNNVVKPTVTFLTLAILGFIGFLFYLYIVPALTSFGGK